MYAHSFQKLPPNREASFQFHVSKIRDFHRNIVFPENFFFQFLFFKIFVNDSFDQ